MLAIPGQLLSLLLPADKLKSQCGFSTVSAQHFNFNSHSLCSDKNSTCNQPSAASPMFSLLSVADTGPQTVHSSPYPQSWDMETWCDTMGYVHPPESTLGLHMLLGRTEIKECYGKLLCAHSAFLLIFWFS